MSWLQNGSQKVCYFGEEVMTLFPQEMRGWDFFQFHMDQVWLGKNKYKKTNLEELQDMWCIFYLVKHKKKYLADLHIMHSLYLD